MRLATYRWLLPLPACILAQLAFGSFYAFGIFTSHHDSPSLTRALGLSALFLSLSITLTGLVLHTHPHPSPARALTVLSTLLLAVSALLPVYALPTSPRPALLALCCALMGLGYGALYVLSIHVALLWAPTSPGACTGTVVTASGIGSLLFIRLNTALVASSPTLAAAMRTSSVAVTIIAALAAAAMSVPPLDWTPDSSSPSAALLPKSISTPPLPQPPPSSTPSADDDDRRLLVLQKQSSIELACEPRHRHGVASMLHTRAFWLLLLAICAAVGPGFGVVLSGSRMQTALLAVPAATADARFFFISLVGVAGRVAVGLIVDAYARHVHIRSAGAITAADAELRSAKTVTLSLLLMQALALVAARAFVVIRAPLSFAASLAAVYLCFSGGAVVTACLCKAVFPAAATLAFALLGTSIGVGDAVFSAVVADCASGGGNGFEGERGGEYDLFFGLAWAMSVAGCFACGLIDRGGAGGGDDDVVRRLETGDSDTYGSCTKGSGRRWNGRRSGDA